MIYFGQKNMTKKQQDKSAFDLIAKNTKDNQGNTIEVWYARELQQVLGYARLCFPITIQVV